MLLRKFAALTNVAHVENTGFWKLALLEGLFEHSWRLGHFLFREDPSSPVYPHSPFALCIFEDVDAVIGVCMHWRHYKNG